MIYPTAHKDKLIVAISNNSKVPKYEVQRLKNTLAKYEQWISNIEAITVDQSINKNEKVQKLVAELNNYKNHVEIELIFDSDDDFLYRQKGQMKLDNSVIEEFLPRLVCPEVIGNFNKDKIVVGPTKSLSNLQFKSDITGIYRY